MTNVYPHRRFGPVETDEWGMVSMHATCDAIGAAHKAGLIFDGKIEVSTGQGQYWICLDGYIYIPGIAVEAAALAGFHVVDWRRPHRCADAGQPTATVS